MHHLQGQGPRWAPLFKGVPEETAASLTKENVIFFLSFTNREEKKK